MNLTDVAKCQRCGRGFVWVNPESDMIDHYEPQRANVWAERGRECGGKIEMLSVVAPISRD